MKRKTPDRTCAGIESMLVKRQFTILRPDLDDTIDRHLATCSRCAAFDRVLSGLSGRLETGGPKIGLDPEIKKRLTAQLVSAHSAGSWNAWILRRVHNAFRIQVPLYRVAAGIAAVFLIVALWMAGLPVVFEPGDTKKPVVRDGFPGRTENRLILKVGRNVREDSLLQRALPPTL